MPFGAVVSGVAVIQSGVVIVIVSTVTDGIGVGNIVAGSLAGNGAITPGIIQILCLQGAVGVVDSHHIALEVPLEVAEVACAAGDQLHTNDAAFVIQEHDALVGSALAVERLGAAFSNQTARVIVVVVLGVGSDLTSLYWVKTRSAFRVAVVLGYPLAKGIVLITVAAGAIGKVTGSKSGQLALAPDNKFVVISSGTTHRVIGNGGAAEAGQFIIGVTEGGSHRCVAGCGAQGKGVCLDGGQVTNIIILVNEGFCKTLMG